MPRETEPLWFANKTDHAIQVAQVLDQDCRWEGLVILEADFIRLDSTNLRHNALIVCHAKACEAMLVAILREVFTGIANDKDNDLLTVHDVGAIQVEDIFTMWPTQHKLLGNTPDIRRFSLVSQWHSTDKHIINS